MRPGRHVGQCDMSQIMQAIIPVDTLRGRDSERVRIPLKKVMDSTSSDWSSAVRYESWLVIGCGSYIKFVTSYLQEILPPKNDH